MGAILLVRHGQASFGTDDYDRLSPLGLVQSRVLGTVLGADGAVPAYLVSGAMRRQRETASAIIKGAGWNCDVVADSAWDEFNVLSFVQGRLDGPAKTDSRAFQAVLEGAMRSWAAGGQGTGESFASFSDRVESGVQRLVDVPDPAGPVIATTSAGAISWVVTSLLGGGVEQWIRLNRVCINSSVTKLVSGRSGVSFVSFNEHGHLSAAQVTYR